MQFVSGCRSATEVKPLLEVSNCASSSRLEPLVFFYEPGNLIPQQAADGHRASCR
jgi:hypothetical protein